MTNGVEQYKDRLDHQIQTIIGKHPEHEEVLRDFYDFLVANTETPATCVAYMRIISKFLTDTNKKAEDLRFRDFSRHMVANNRKNRSYLIQIYSGLKLFAHFLVLYQYVTEDYMATIKRPRAVESQQTIDKRNQKYLNDAEIQIYINNVKNSNCTHKTRDLFLIQLALNTGMRRAALYKLDVDSIDFNRSVVRVNDKEEKFYECYLVPELVELAKAWLAERPKYLKKGNENDPALFLSQRGTRLGYDSIKDIIVKYKGDINKLIAPHALRASFGTGVWKATKDLKITQEALHHANPAPTFIYVRDDSNSAQTVAAQSVAHLTFR